MKVLDVDGLKRVASNVKDKITEEANIRQDVDASLSTRIGSAETDLTGIKGLTYGSDAKAFFEVDDGDYSSPALEEIQHEIEDGSITWFNLDALPEDAYQTMHDMWPHVAVYKSGTTMLPTYIDGFNGVAFTSIKRVNDYNQSKMFYVKITPPNTVAELGSFNLNPNSLLNANKMNDAAYSFISNAFQRARLYSGNVQMYPCRYASNSAIFSSVDCWETEQPDSNGEDNFAAVRLCEVNTTDKTNQLGTLQLVLHRYFDFAHLKAKPFSTIGSGLKVEDDALAVDALTNDDIDAIFTDVLG